MNFLNDRPIGVFDSGVGGLSVLKELKKTFPNENFIYVADTLRMPYGEREAQEIVQYTRECFKKLEEENVKLVAIACNTSTSYSLEEMKKEFDFPVIGVTGAGSLDASLATKNKKILIMATNATVKSGIFEELVGKVDSKVEIKLKGCPQLVRAVEEGKGQKAEYEIVKSCIGEFKNYDYDTLLLGCTHFPLAKKAIEEVLKEENKKVNLIDPAKSIAIDLKTIMNDLRMLSEKNQASIKYFVTGDEAKFKKVAYKLLNLKEEELEVENFEVES